MLMVALVVLFPVLLVQYGVTLAVLYGAESSSILSLDPRQLIVLVATVLLLGLGFRLVMAVSSTLIEAVIAERQDGDDEVEQAPEVTADDALRNLRQGLREARALDGPTGPAVRSLVPLVVAYVVVYVVMLKLTGNEMTIGTAFLLTCAFLIVGTLLSPVPATAVWLSRSWYVPPEPEPEPELKPDPELEQAAKAVKAGAPDSIAPPGSSAPAPASVAPPGTEPAEPAEAEQPAAPADTESVPASTSAPATPWEAALMSEPSQEPESAPEGSPPEDPPDQPRGGSVPPPV